MKLKSESLICDSCKHQSYCKFAEDAKKVKYAYDSFVNGISIPEKCIFSLTSAPIICPNRDGIYQVK